MTLRATALALLTALAVSPAAADQNDPGLDDLFERLLKAPDLSTVQPIEADIWQLWYAHEDTAVQILMQRGAEAFGARRETEAAYGQAWARFETILEELAAELPALRAPLDDAAPAILGPVARAMGQACTPHRASFVTPMAAVAGAVADATLAAMTERRELEKAYVNNGGDIALYLTPGAALTSGLGARAVTVAVGPLPSDKIDTALARGLDRARVMARRGLVDACLALQGENRVLGRALGGLVVSAA